MRYLRRDHTFGITVECRAILCHLRDQREVVHPAGTIYHQGMFIGEHRSWSVAVAEIGMGGVSAATETERAINFFRPQLLLFVGIAGGLKNVRHGDVVAATKVYAYEAGEAMQQFKPHPAVWRASYALEQRARAEAHHDEWLARLKGPDLDPVPRVFLGALAAGEKVLASKKSSVYRLLLLLRACMERMKSRAFLRRLSVGELPQSPRVPHELLEREAQLLPQLRQLAAILAGPVMTDGPSLLSRYQTIEKDLHDVWNEMEQYDQEYVELRRGMPISWKDVRCLLVAN